MFTKIKFNVDLGQERKIKKKKKKKRNGLAWQVLN